MADEAQSDAQILRLSVTPKPELDLELGVTMNLPFSSLFDGGGLASHDPVPLDDLIRMRKQDGHVRALWRLLTLPVIAAMHEAAFVPDNGGTETDGDDEAEFVQNNFLLPPRSGGMHVPFTKFMRQLLLAVVEGYSAFEKVFYIPDDGPLAGKICIKKIAWRASNTVRFLIDEVGDFNGFRQVANAQGHSIDVIIPKEKAFYWSANEEENPFYGVSYFLPAFFHYDKKIKLYYIAHIAAQFAAVSGRLGSYPENTDVALKNAFKAALADFGFNTAMLVPPGYEVKPFEASKGSFDYVKLIDHHNAEMSKSVLAQFLDSTQRQTLMDFSTDKDDMFIMGLNAMMDTIADQINHYIIPDLIDWNFGTGKYPHFRFGPIADTTKDALKDVFNALTTASAPPWSADFIHEMEKKMAQRLELELDYDELDDEFEEAKEQQNELADAQTQAQLAQAKLNEQNALNPPEPAPAPAPGPAPVKASALPGPGFVSFTAIARRVAEHLRSDGLDELADDVIKATADMPHGPDGKFNAEGGSGQGKASTAGTGAGAGAGGGLKGGGTDPKGRKAAEGGRSSDAEIRAARATANQKIRNAPAPTEADRAAHEAMVARQSGSRSGGDGRGNSSDRASRTSKLLTQFGDGTHCPCVHCGRTLDKSTLTQDRIYPGKLGGKYSMNNLVPACFTCNASRPDVKLTAFKGVGRAAA